MASIFTIRGTDGTSGTVEVYDDRLVVTNKKRLRKDDVVMIPIKTITAALHQPKMLSHDIVALDCTSANFVWKSQHAEELVDAVNKAMFA